MSDLRVGRGKMSTHAVARSGQRLLDEMATLRKETDRVTTAVMAAKTNEQISAALMSHYDYVLLLQVRLTKIRMEESL